ncbi:PpiC-type peptidyl-prolyl cis-trans isomerase [Arcobacter nitrofigilis DSM 7299]|uniref:peptidylprolyl isomerase n=1 Tax=Arcobacter nitrofigilis (strain ATCC 33309 / DSM 7299 / CCUG 15893 / LMG 7604 / NCTC 12251 / CI) TaxID=572480 RepID=D5V1T6_ARCNC|nr:peptidyl-prolyl cis-trans isomerase [Arcobacter nitrofigilis]ADG93520.1 PpiC-type peptidyl-prolyl cis-trans isomerase [Arcobacter nitrofigilis DSM 7299]
MKKLVYTLSIVVSLFSSTYASDILAVVNGGNVTSEVAPNNFKTLDNQIQKNILNKLIEKRLVSDYALKTDIVKSEEYKKVLKHILKMSDENDNKEGNENLADIVKQKSIKGYTQEQLNSKKGLLAFDFLLTQKAEQLLPSDKELEKYYNDRRYKYDTPAQIELLSIVVEKLSLAKEIIKKLQNAKDILQEFSILAKKYSLAPTAKNSGYFGKIPLSVLNSELSPILKDKKRGFFTNKPIKTEFGYEIFYILNDIPEYNSTFEGVKDKVKEEYVKKTVKTWAINKIKELKEKAVIKIY